MDKCREEFEKWLDDNNMFMNIERRFDQESNTYDYCAIRWIWESWQHQQAKVEELQKRVEWLEDRLKATDTLSKMRAAVIGSFNSQEFNARTRRKMMILKRAEQALKGEG